jgi:hypothetical protein
LSFVDARGPARPFALAVGGAALTTASLLCVILFVEEGILSAGTTPLIFSVALIVASLVIALAGALIGLPLTWLLARTRSEAPWAYPAAGLAAGGGIAMAFERLVMGDVPRPVPDLLWQTAPLGAVPGLVCGALWWWLYRRHMRAGA